MTHTRPMKVRWRTSARAVGSKRLIFTEVAKKIEQKPGAASGHLCPHPRGVCPRVKATQGKADRETVKVSTDGLCFSA